jgi:hypothetical protein
MAPFQPSTISSIDLRCHPRSPDYERLDAAIAGFRPVSRE